MTKYKTVKTIIGLIMGIALMMLITSYWSEIKSFLFKI